MTVAHISPWQQALLLKQAVSVWPDRLPRHAWALGILMLALLLGVVAADDYGVWGDTYTQIAIGEANLRHLAGESGLNLLRPPTDRLYGPVFEVLLRLAQRILHPEEGHGLGFYDNIAIESVAVVFIRHLLTHLLFLASGFAGYLLAWRMFGNRWLALFALLLFLLHPRIYAHSFFNSKDVPFLAMFMICLWLAHRAFRPQSPAHSSSTAVYGATAVYGTNAIYGAAGTAGANAVYGAFALCGVAAGLLTNLRMSGLVFVALVILMRLCDVVLADDWRERRRAIASCALFAFASVATYYATMPYIWADPLERVREIVTVMFRIQPALDGYPQGEAPPSYLPAARSTFDVYLEDGTLTYIKNPCVQADTEAPFFVHVWPAHVGDLRPPRRRLGFEALDFRIGAWNPSWRTAGDIFDGVCMATLALPDYPIANIATGQHTPGGGSLWRVDIGGG